MIRGSSAITDSRKKVYKQNFPKLYDSRIEFAKIVPHMKQVNEWVEKKTLEILGFEDDVLNGLIENYLTNSQNQISTGARTEDERLLDPKEFHITIQPFLGEKHTPAFMTQLLQLLVEYKDNKDKFKKIAEEKSNEQNSSLNLEEKEPRRHKSRDRDTGRDKDRDRNRDKDSDRRRSRSRDRHRRRSRSRDRRRRRSRSRDRDRDEKTDRSRRRDRDRKRARSRSRDRNNGRREMNRDRDRS